MESFRRGDIASVRSLDLWRPTPREAPPTGRLYLDFEKLGLVNTVKHDDVGKKEAEGKKSDGSGDRLSKRPKRRVGMTSVRTRTKGLPKELVEKMQRKSPQMRKVLLGLSDKSRVAAITKTELQQHMGDAGLYLTEREISRVMQALDRDGQGKIIFTELCDVILEHDRKPVSESSQGKARSEEVSTTTKSSDRPNSLIGALSEKLKEKLIGKSNQIRKVFLELDKDRNSVLTPREFQKGMSQLGLKISTSEMKELMQVLDPDRSGGIVYKEFCDVILADDQLHGGVNELAPEERARGRKPFHHKRKLPQIDEEALEKVRKDVLPPELKEKLVGKSKEMRKLFLELDRDRNSVLTPREFRGGVSKLGIDISADDMDKLMEVLDPDKSGGIAYDEFCDVVLADDHKHGGIDGIAGDEKIRRKKRIEARPDHDVIISDIRRSDKLGSREKLKLQVQLKVLNKLSEQCSGPNEQAQRLLHLFRASRPDEFGFITKQGFVQTVGRKFELSPRSAELFFEVGDPLKNGELNYNQFRDAFKRVDASTTAVPNDYRPILKRDPNRADETKPSQARSKPKSFSEMSYDEREEFRTRNRVAAALEHNRHQIKQRFARRSEFGKSENIRTKLSLEEAAQVLNEFGVRISLDTARRYYASERSEQGITFSQLCQRNQDYFNQLDGNTRPNTAARNMELKGQFLGCRRTVHGSKSQASLLTTAGAQILAHSDMTETSRRRNGDEIWKSRWTTKTLDEPQRKNVRARVGGLSEKMQRGNGNFLEWDDNTTRSFLSTERSEYDTFRSDASILTPLSTPYATDRENYFYRK